jgi:Phosphotransferase enzyme family
LLDKDQGDSVKHGGSRVDYRKQVVQTLRQHFRVSTDIEVVELDAVLEEHFESKHLREIESVIAQVMFSGHNADIRMAPNRLRLSPMAGGLSGSRVFRLRAENRISGFPAVPAVLKISKREFAEQELENFHRFVTWGLPYIMRVDVLGAGFTKDFGAIAYSFVLSDNRSFRPLIDIIRQGDFELMKRIVEKIFNPDTRRWFSDQLLVKEENINARYSGRYFRGPNNRDMSAKKFSSIVSQTFSADVGPISIKIDGKVYNRRIERLFGVPNGELFSCICHGDFNASNVIVADNEGIIFIDFQETGRGHVFEDFITLEASIRLNCGDDPTVTWRDFLQAEENLGMGGDLSGLSPMHRMVATIRHLAIRNFPNEPVRNYFYGVAAYNFRLLRVPGLSDGQGRRCVCALLAALRAMEGVSA